jgi:peptidoglycan-N-acetylglucosamine deacetylase
LQIDAKAAFTLRSCFQVTLYPVLYALHRRKRSNDMTDPHLSACNGFDPGERRWPVKGYPAALTLSTAWHAAALVGCALEPSTWPWWLAGTFANHAAVTIPGLLPRSSMLGPNWTRLPDLANPVTNPVPGAVPGALPSATPANARSIALTIDDGPDPVVTPRVLDLLDTYGIRATFFCIGERALRYPALTREIAARGHAVENHSQRHRHTFSVSGPLALAREVDDAQRTLTALTGQRPAFFRAPAGLRNVLLEPVLQKRDLRLVAWTRRGFDTRESDPRVVQARLLRDLAPRDILLLHDGNAAHTNDGVPVVLAVLPGIAEAARRQDLRFVTLRDAFQPARAPEFGIAPI